MGEVPSWRVAAILCAALAVLMMSVGAQTLGYNPAPGAETACLKFTLDLYNRNSGRAVRAGVLDIKSPTVQVLRSIGGNPTEMWYRFYGTVLVDTTCPNTPDNVGATLQKCPLINPNTTTAIVPWTQTCDFKTWYAPSLNPNDRFKMIYTMCRTPMS